MTEELPLYHNRALGPGPYQLGETFSAADVHLGSQLAWGTMMEAFEPPPVIEDYLGAAAGAAGEQAGGRKGRRDHRARRAEG